MAINPLQAPINYAGMVPQINIGQQFAELGQVLVERQKRTQAEEVKAAYAADLQNAINNPTQETWSQMIAKYPQQREAFNQARKGYGEVAATNEFNQGFEVSMALENNKPEVAKQRLLTIISARENAKLPTNIYKDVLDQLESDNVKGAQAGVNYALTIVDPERFEKIVNARVTAEKAPSEITKFTAEANKAVTESQQKVADLRIKLQNEPDKAKQLALETQIKEIEANFQEKVIQADLDLKKAQTGQANQAAAKYKKDLEDEGVKVQSSSILPNGTVVFVTTNGKTRVVGPDGVELTGQERVDAVRDAEQFGADIQQLRSGARKAGEVGQTEAAKAFENVGKIRRNISNLDSAIAALDAGATTGVIASKFPNWKASTIELQNVQRQLGLDIIGSVTFGALSEGELSLALETALPLNMNEPQLKDWLIRKKTAQNKLADYITEQARFLSIPGRSLGDWLIQAEKRGQPPGMTPPGTGAAGAAAAAAPPLPKSATVGGKTYTRPPSFTDKQWGDYLKSQGVTP